MKISPLLAVLGIFAGGFTAAHATNIGFGQLGGSNAPIPVDLGSFATTDSNGLVVSNGATPNIALSWDAEWDIHTSNFFAPLENQFVGGGAWDNEGDIPRIAQLELGFHTIQFIVEDGYALVLNSFDFGHTAETAGTTQWDLTLTDSNENVVWADFVIFENGQVFTIAPEFTGDPGESYTLTFNRVDQTYPSNGRHGIDNLSFNQIAVPEPGVVALLGLGASVVLLRRRRH